jgi:hypothetical protein
MRKRRGKVLPEYEIHHFDMGKDYVTIKNARYLILSNSSFAVLPAMTSDTVQFIIAPKYWGKAQCLGRFLVLRAEHLQLLSLPGQEGKAVYTGRMPCGTGTV